MAGQPVCSADDCENSIADDRIELVEVPVDGTGEWRTVNVADCVECHEQQQALLAEFDAMG
jgi:Tfp pilus assembly protein PilP